MNEHAEILVNLASLDWQTCNKHCVKIVTPCKLSFTESCLISDSLLLLQQCPMLPKMPSLSGHTKMIATVAPR